MNKTKIGGRIVQRTNRRQSNGVNDHANGSNDGRGNGTNGAHRNGIKRRGGFRKPNVEAADQRYIDPYEFAPFGYVSFDRAGGVEQANLAACGLLDCKRYSLVGAPFTRWVLPGDLEVYLRHLVRCRGGERRVESKLHLKKRSGEVLSVLLSSTPTKDLRRSQLYQTAIVDLTEHERAEEALRSSDERYHTLFDLVPLAVYACDAKGIIQEYNRRAVKLWGREPGRNGSAPRFCGSYKIYYPDGRPMPHQKCPMARALRGEKLTAKDLEIIVEHPDGKRRHVIPAPSVLKNRRGKITGAINCLYDITKQKRAEEELKSELAATQRLHQVSTLLIQEGEFEKLYNAILDAAVEIMHADMASMQMVDETRDGLRLLAWRGFNPDFGKIFGFAGAETRTSCSTARRLGHRVIVPDVEKCDFIAGTPSLEDHRNTGVRAVQSTPLFSRQGRMLGMISTHWRTPHRPKQRELRLMDVLARQAADLIERLQTEQALRENERRFREMIEALPAAVYTTDAEGRITHFNRACVEFSGREPQIGDHWCVSWKLYYPDGRPMPHEECPMAITLKTGRAIRGAEAIAERPDGSRIYFMPFPTPIHDATGRVIGGINMLVDITERKKTEALLAEASRQRELLLQFVQRRSAAQSLKEIYSIALDSIIDTLRCDRASILLLDKDGVMRFAAWRGLSEHYRKAVEGHSPWKRNEKNPQPISIEDVDLADLSVDLNNAIKREGIRAVSFIPLMAEARLIGKFMMYYNSPHNFTHEETSVALNIGGQLALGVERKRAEIGLRESEERLRAIVHQATAGMARADLTGRLLFVNQKFCQMLGYRESELIGKRIQEFTYEADIGKTSELFKRLVSHKRHYETEKRYMRRNGSIIWVNVSASPICDGKGRVRSAGAVVVDISARKKAEAALRRSKQLLQELVEHRTRALRLANEGLHSEIGRRKGLESQMIEISDREQQRLGQELHDGLCQQLTAIAFMARASALRLKDHRAVQVDDLEEIAELINSSVSDARQIAYDLHKHQIEAAGFEDALRDLASRQIWKTPCRLKLDGELDLKDDKVASQIYRILREGVINANKHAQATEIIVEMCRRKRETVFSVTDDGVGIRRGIKTHEGLGFHIIQYRAQSVGARLEVKSPRRGGTRLALYLPASK